MNEYTFALLDPRPIDAAREANDAVLNNNAVLGVEVTVPALAKRCSLGNVDPQHLGNDASRAAIEDALSLPLPPEGATLATVRADIDSLGSMAILGLRASGATLSTETESRARQIATADKEISGNWPGQKPIAQPEDYLTETSILSAVAQDFKRPVAERVADLRAWLQDGGFEGRSAIQERLFGEVGRALGNLAIRRTVSGLAVVEGNHRLAMSLGYSQAPVVVATNPAFRFAGGEPHRKHTVARWNSEQPMDWDGLKQDLQEAEAGWGGSSSILGSPQGQPSQLTTGEVVNLTEQHL
ncbi:MAG: hypothetical protein ACREHG_09130 [Candidatus Saccharimonadales bacterium]